MGYQSFGDIQGDSDSYGKLQAIRLPDLSGKSFLDVGCNAGYFCHAALRAGASKVVGLDASLKEIEAARMNFPAATFHAGSWDTLPEGEFDVVILLSALHYAGDQAELIERLMGKVARNGLLVLEVGIAPGLTAEWVATKRAIDTRLFPTMAQMQKLLERYTYRLIGRSVSQAGDPNPRFVFHVWHRKPVVLACLGDSGVGKSDLARLVASRSGGGVQALHIDDRLVDFAAEHGLMDAGPEQNLAAGIGLVDLSQLYLAICRTGLLEELARDVASGIRESSLSLIEGGLPYGYRTHFLNQLGRILDVDIWNMSPLRVRSIEPRCEIADQHEPPALPQPESQSREIVGYVDEFRLRKDGFVVVGWGYDRAHREPIEGVRIVQDGVSLDLMQLNRRRRPDVSRQLESELDMLGFVVEVPLEAEVVERMRRGVEEHPPSVLLWASGMLSPGMNPKSVTLDF